MTFGERLRLYRKAAQMSQQNLQAKTGIPQTTLSGWESGSYEPTVSDIFKLADVFQISVEKLLTGLPANPRRRLDAEKTISSRDNSDL